MIRYYSKVIRIRGQDSPNVRLAQAELAAGKRPSGAILIPGVLTYEEYVKRCATWDKVRLCIGIEASFWEGAEFLLYPPEWLNLAADPYKVQKAREMPTEAIGIDPGEGQANTSMSAVNRYGLKEQVNLRTPNTAVITSLAIDFLAKHANCSGDSLKSHPLLRKTLFDHGGGGKEHADRLRFQGYNVSSVGFGENPSLDIRRGLHQLKDRKDMAEERYQYLNRRSQMYGELSLILDPSLLIHPDGLPWDRGFAISAEYVELRQQMAVIPRRFDGEGRMRLPPKNRRAPNSEEECLVDIIGHSPDELDSLVLAVHALLHKTSQMVVGAY